MRMKAVVRHHYGAPEILELNDVDTPVPGDGEVLVQVRAASLNPYDWHMVRGEPYVIRLMAGLRAPKDHGVGIDVAGIVHAVGSGVTDLAVGDEVFGLGDATLAEFAVSKAIRLARKPERVSFESAAAVPCAGVTALQALGDKGSLVAGQRVLINGAAGGVGTFAVQIARSMDASVTGVCSTRNMGFVRDLGADDVIDYTADDFSRGAHRYDLILDAVGNRSLAELRRALAPQGTLVLCGAPKGRWVRPFSLLAGAAVRSRFARQRLVSFMASVTTSELDALAASMQGGALVPVIERTCELADSGEALARVEEGHVRGKVVIRV